MNASVVSVNEERFVQRRHNGIGSIIVHGKRMASWMELQGARAKPGTLEIRNLHELSSDYELGEAPSFATAPS